jgi:hypothetical protein
MAGPDDGGGCLRCTLLQVARRAQADVSINKSSQAENEIRLSKKTKNDF